MKTLRAELAVPALAAALIITLAACAADIGALPTRTESVAASLAPSMPAGDPSSGGSQASVTPGATLSAPPIEETEVICSNAELGYSVSYPASWYVFPAADPVRACTVFGPEPFDAEAGGSIKLSAIQGACYDKTREPDAVARVVVDGSPTERREYDVLFNGPGYIYVVDRNPIPSCGNETDLLLLETDHDAPGDFEVNKRVLDRIVATLDLTP